MINELKKWLKDNDFDCDVKYDDYSSYSYMEDIIYINKDKSDHIELYKDYITKLGYDGSCSDEVIIFLHEVGHYQTMDDLPEWCYALDKLKKLIETPSLFNFTVKLKTSLYYRLPVEKAATLWMLEFIIDNPKEVKKLERIFHGKQKRQSSRQR